MIEQYWKEFLIKHNLPADTKYYESFKFGYNKKQANELLDLVLKGKKVATTSPYFENEEYPKIGDYSIVLDSDDMPRCIIKTTNYQIMKFNEMTYDICKLEGEDETLDTWISNHVNFIEHECKTREIKQ